MAGSRNTYVSICTRYLFHLPCFSGPFCVGSKRDGYRNGFFSISLSDIPELLDQAFLLEFFVNYFWLRSYRSFPVQEGVREGWEIYQGKEHITVVNVERKQPSGP